METLKVGIDVDTTAIKAATAALDELACAADRAKTALDALFAQEVIINVDTPPFQGVRPAGQRFRG